MYHQARHARLHVGEPYHAIRDASPDVAPVVSVIYVTADPTFTGPIAGYTTIEFSAQSTTVGEPNFYAGTSSAVALVKTTTQPVPSRAQQPDKAPSSIVDFIASTPTIISAPTGALTVSGLPTNILSAPASSDAAASSSIVLNSAPVVAAPNASQSATSGTYQGMSGGAKAGLAFGLIAALALVFALIFFMYRRKKAKNDRHQQLIDEKSLSTLHQPQASMASIGSHVSVMRTEEMAPRQSLRPVTEMLSSPIVKSNHPGFSRGDNQLSQDENPFGDHAGGPRHVRERFEQNPRAHDSTLAAVPKPLSINSHRSGNGPVRPAGRGGSHNPARGRPPPAERNVHRVHLDFVPTMDDELELRAGQLVRMLHEYDDGWALCVRLDRSQQGVVPRTCISQFPVKPRPAGPLPGVRGNLRGAPQGHPRGPPQSAIQPITGTTMGSTSSSGLNNYLQNTSMSPVASRARSKSNGPVLNNAQSWSIPLGGYQNANQAPNRPRAYSASSRRPIASGTSSLNPQALYSGSDGVLSIRRPVPGQAI